MIHSGSKMGGLLARAVLGVAVAGCALPAMQYAQVATLRTNAPNEAARIAPRDARVLANILGRRFEENPGFKPSADDLTNIKAALAAQPLEPKLISVLGLAYEAAGNTQQASGSMELADRASRHDAVSGLYLIEAASSSGDVHKALRHYNAVLSIQPELYPALFPILASAVSYPEIRTALRSYLKRGARWLPPFVAAAAESANAKDLEALLLPLPAELSQKEYAPALSKVLYRLALQGDKEATGRFAAAIIPGLPDSEVSNPSISVNTLDKRLGSLAWTFPHAEGIRVDPHVPNSIQIVAEPLSRGVVASRDLLLDGGQSYEFMQRLDYMPGSRLVSARWTADCITLTGSQHFWEQRMPANEQLVLHRSVVNVPLNCHVARLSLFIEGPDDQLPSSLSINSITLVRSNRAPPF